LNRFRFLWSALELVSETFSKFSCYLGIVMKIRNLKFTLVLGTPMLGISGGAVFAAEEVHAEDRLEQIVVTAPFEQSEAETALPIGILSGEALQEKIGNSLGDTLKNEIGVNSASFGTGVGQPIIRGQTGNRVTILQNGVGVTDASSLSPDHANSVEASLAERVEVVRGPSTLLYGSGAIGGVVNVIDNRVPETLVDSPEFVIQQSRNSVNNEEKTVIKLDASAGNFAFHLDAFRRDSENVDISGFAIDEFAVEELEELAEALHEEEGHDEEEHDEDEFENTRGFIGNSDSESDGATLGFSWVGSNGFIGFSANELNNDYGLPPGTHGHHEEEEHEEEGHDEGEDEHEDEEAHEDVEFVRIGMESRRYDIRGGYEFADSWIDSVRGSLGFTDYEHGEIEFFEDGGSEVGTLFSNEGTEGRFTLSHVPVGDWNGVWGFQFSDTEFSAIGEEAFIPRSDISSRALFGVERFTQGNLTAELGFRFEDNDVDPNGSCGFDGSATSLSGSVLYDFSSNSNVLVGMSRSERAPSVEELFSNTSSTTCARFADDEDLVLHAATGLLEVGNPNLSEETSNNIELGYRLHSGAITGEFSAYYNKIDDYIFLNLSGEEHEEQPIASYLAQDATFRGLEGEISFSLMERDSGSLALSLFGDLVDAEFDSGGNVPRIPAAKVGAELRYFGSNWSMHLHVTDVQQQDEAGDLELDTDGYTLVSVYADYHWTYSNDSELKLFVRGDNLLDEEVRNHASLLKNFSPEPGRGVTMGLRFEY
jgi:iron complex outermembrane receptor protein